MSRHVLGRPVFTLKIHLHVWGSGLHLIRGSSSPPGSSSQMASQSVQPFLHSSQPFHMGDLDPPTNWRFLGPTQVNIPNGIMCFCRAHGRDRSTDRSHYSICSSRSHLASGVTSWLIITNNDQTVKKQHLDYALLMLLIWYISLRINEDGYKVNFRTNLMLLEFVFQEFTLVNFRVISAWRHGTVKAHKCCYGI